MIFSKAKLQDSRPIQRFRDVPHGSLPVFLNVKPPQLLNEAMAAAAGKRAFAGGGPR